MVSAVGRQLAELYFSGTTSAFVLHGNTYDLRAGRRATMERGTAGLAEFLAEQLFGRWSLVLHYDLGRGLRVAAGRDEQRLKEMVMLANRKVGDLSALPKEPPRNLRAARSVRAQQHHGRGSRAPQPGVHPGSGVVRLPVRRARPPERASVVAARDDAELGDEPARQAAEHGVRAGG